MLTKLIFDKDIYNEVILGIIPKAHKYLWIGTSDIKDLYVEMNGKMVSFLQVLSQLLQHKIEIRLLFAKEPGEAFRTDFDKFPVLANKLEQFHCPRVHFKMVIVDGVIAYSGSANLTGAGMGAKSINNRNFEMGIVTSDSNFVNELMNQFDAVWMGKHCKSCGRKLFCTEWKSFL